MQSRLVQISKINKILFTTPNYKTIRSSLFSSASSGNLDQSDGDDAMTQGVDTDGETGDPKTDDGDGDGDVIPTKKDDRYMHPKTVPLNMSSSKLQTPGVNTPVDPHMQQKRTKSEKIVKEELSCAGPDGSPWPEDKSDVRKEQHQDDDDREYFKHQKASPLSEIEIVDSRKPLTQVAHGTAGGGYFGDEKVMTWTAEQLDTAEETLLRAAEMFRETAARGVPEWPHSRRLRELRGEDW